MGNSFAKFFENEDFEDLEVGISKDIQPEWNQEILKEKRSFFTFPF